jgi:hypothetical protein
LACRDYPAQHLFDPVNCPRRLFDSGARLRADVHIETPGIDCRKEVFTEEGKQPYGNRGKPQYCEYRHFRVTQTNA